MSIARYTLICSLKSAHREVRHSTNKKVNRLCGTPFGVPFLFSTYKSVLEIKHFLNTLTSNTKGQRFHLSKII